MTESVTVLLALLLALAPSARAKTAVMSVDPGDPAYEATHDDGQQPGDQSDAKDAKPAKGKKKAKKGKKGKEKEPQGAGDVQVGPAVAPAPKYQEPQRKPPRPTAALAGSRVPGIFAVYDEGGHWMLLDRSGKSRVGAGSEVVVIGARGLGQFRVEKATRTYEASCEGHKHVARRGWLLGAKDGKLFKRVGVPVIAILLKPGARFDARAARLARMKNDATEELYRKVETALKTAVAEDLKSGSFQMDIGDEEGHRTATAPDPDKIRLKLDFASKIRLPSLDDPRLLIEGAEYSRSYRRCLQLMDGAKTVGPCVEMPHELMAETGALDFVAYAPAKGVPPFVLAYTEKPPLWGHERWGFQTTPEGMKLFLRDALDPRCRDSF